MPKRINLPDGQQAVESTKGFFGEFKAFISKGNVMDMAVGIIIGGAFTTIVKSLVSDIISPLLGLVGGMNFDQFSLKFAGVTLAYGKFLTAVINFLMMAFVLFFIVKAFNRAGSLIKKEEEVEEEVEEEATTKVCPYCKSEIDIEASRCPMCTSQLEEKMAEQ
ncbi:large conductance mechanosensitive channel protein MscL [Lactobacillus delbrueckii]|uniref:large conductance mechanosensitive channel protein MscL n=1 Tax=Lactobacillus delbrueckii TaxID=1584 RepID=UPI0013DF5929|nr:large conductance mechanosensitive channel protein MscL [Lactobacillus delbrueckii]QIE61170.1 large conductance mechanosensitive channel protein MscL [Lactobacillus delbrueckii subsp. bulgaricus]